MAYPLFCLIGLSGSGKSTIAKNVYLKEVVSYKTRPIRRGEEEGVSGYFIKRRTFERMIEEDQFIIQTLYNQNYYGITQGEILDLETQPMLYVIDYDSYVKMKENMSKMEGYKDQKIVSIFIDADPTELKARMLRQGRDIDEVNSRIERFALDSLGRDRCDYAIRNKDGKLHKAITEVQNIIFKETFDV